MKDFDRLSDIQKKYYKEMVGYRPWFYQSEDLKFGISFREQHAFHNEHYIFHRDGSIYFTGNRTNVSLQEVKRVFKKKKSSLKNFV